MLGDTDATSFLHLNPPFRAEHMGSLLRPAALLEKRAQFEAQSCSAEELRVAENAAITDAVKLQQSVGIQSVTDGEMRRYVRPRLVIGVNHSNSWPIEEPSTKASLSSSAACRILPVSVGL